VRRARRRGCEKVGEGHGALRWTVRTALRVDRRDASVKDIASEQVCSVLRQATGEAMTPRPQR